MELLYVFTFLGLYYIFWILSRLTFITCHAFAFGQPLDDNTRTCLYFPLLGEMTIGIFLIIFLFVYIGSFFSFIHTHLFVNTEKRIIKAVAKRNGEISKMPATNTNPLAGQLSEPLKDRN